MLNDDADLSAPRFGEEAPKKGCLLAKWYVLVPTLLVLVFGGCCVTCGGIFAFGMSEIKKSPVTIEAIRLRSRTRAWPLRWARRWKCRSWTSVALRTLT